MEEIHLHDLVALTEDIRADHFVHQQHLLLRRGQIGTVVMLLDRGHIQVEFADHEGRTYAMLALPAENLMVLREEPEALPA